MFIDGGWAMADVVQNAPKDVLGNTHIALMPSVAGGKGDPQSTSGVVGTGLGVSKKLTGAKKKQLRNYSTHYLVLKDSKQH